MLLDCSQPVGMPFMVLVQVQQKLCSNSHGQSLFIELFKNKITNKIVKYDNGIYTYFRGPMYRIAN